MSNEFLFFNVYSCEKVRSIKGVTYPISLQLIDDIRAVVLCRRELRIYNLDEGVLVTKLKGIKSDMALLILFEHIPFAYTIFHFIFRCYEPKNGLLRSS